MITTENRNTSTIKRILMHDLESAFARITNALDIAPDMDLDFEHQYTLEDIQGDIQNVIESIQGGE